MTRSFLVAALVSQSLLGCDTAATPLENNAPQYSANGVVMSATGGGQYLLPGDVPVKFSFSAKQKLDGTASGQFRIAFTDSGFSYDVHGEVICMASDPVTGRAWIGGLVTSNTSTDPGFQTGIHQPGDDVWFRVLDAGEGHGVVDRTSFYGFRGAAGLLTSADYCAARIWANGNARTWPVTEGNISVR